MDIYGIPTQNFAEGNILNIDIPNIKIRDNSLNSEATILFRVLEDTPGMIETTVNLYEKIVRIFRVA